MHIFFPKPLIFGYFKSNKEQWGEMTDKGKFKLCLQPNMQSSALTMLLTPLLLLCKKLTVLLLHELWGQSVPSQISTGSCISWNGALIDTCYLKKWSAYQKSSAEGLCYCFYIRCNKNSCSGITEKVNIIYRVLVKLHGYELIFK